LKKNLLTILSLLLGIPIPFALHFILDSLVLEHSQWAQQTSILACLLSQTTKNSLHPAQQAAQQNGEELQC
jgi:hypothetical protein